MLFVLATLLIGPLHHVDSFLAFLPFDVGQLDAHLPGLATNSLLLVGISKNSFVVLLTHCISLVEETL